MGGERRNSMNPFDNGELWAWWSPDQSGKVLVQTHKMLVINVASAHQLDKISEG